MLAELRHAIEDEFDPSALENVVITVSASFQLAARRDTLRAAALAEFSVSERTLLDEPNAALLDYLLTQAEHERVDFSAPRIVLIFDFGGGTCDVSIVRAQVSGKGRLALSNLAISRYEQLGGDNIDGAIAEQILLPNLLRNNGVDPLDIGWAEKKNRLLPQLLDAAEALKRAICFEFHTQLTLRREGDIDRGKIIASQPEFAVEVARRADVNDIKYDRCLVKPVLAPEQFDKGMEPFLDPDRLYRHGTDLNPVTSIFAPITDALQRAGLRADDVDAVLFVGGSLLIPQVQRAISSYVPGAQLLQFPSLELTLHAVARGAALHALFAQGLGRPLLKPIA